MKVSYLKSKIGLTTALNLSAIILSSIIIIRWWYYIDSYSVNILFWDQWDLYDALFENRNLWELFFWQIGPHREGIGLIISTIIAELSGWNTRYETFAIGCIMCLAMVCALILKRRLSKTLSWTDVTIPLIFLTPLQWEMFVNTPNLSHGSLPILLLILYCLAWTLQSNAFRYSIVLLLNFLLIYTGFGLFIGIITPIVLFIEYLAIHKTAYKKESIILFVSIVISLLSMGSFFIGWRFDSAVENLQFPIPQYWHYFSFIALTLAYFCGMKGVNFAPLVIFGLILMVIMIYISLIHLKCLLLMSSVPSTIPYREYILSKIIFILIAFTLLFCINSAIGRISLGVGLGMTSRYVPYLIPAFYGIYLHLANYIQNNKIRNILLTTMIACLTISTFPLNKIDYQGILMYKNCKTQWRLFYLQTEDVEKTNQTIGCKIYPDAKRTNLKWKLDYLKARKLNLYLDYSGLKPVWKPAIREAFEPAMNVTAFKWIITNFKRIINRLISEYRFYIVNGIITLGILLSWALWLTGGEKKQK